MPTITFNTEELSEVGDNLLATIQGNALILVLEPPRTLVLHPAGRCAGSPAPAAFKVSLAG